MSGKDQGTGKHGHKDTEEPWPHHGQSGSEGGDHESRSQEGGSGSQRTDRGESGSQSRSEEQSLKEREYRDKDGNIHHHTRTYEEQHGKK